MPYRLPASTLLIFLTTACGGHEHVFQKIDDPNPVQAFDSSLRVDLAIQENDFGANITRCQMQVAFEPLPEYTDPDSVNESDSSQSSAPTHHVEEPEVQGTCAYSSVEPPGPPPEGHDDNSGSADSMEGDNWQLSGDVIGPNYVEMWRFEDTWTLDAVETEHGGQRYEWTTCDVADYPFSSTLTMDVPPSDDPDGVYAFTMDELVPVGPRVILDAPMGEHGGQPDLNIEEPLEIVWHHGGDLPTVDGETQEPKTLVKLQTHDHERQEEVRWLVCWPEDDGSLVLSPEDMAPLFEGRVDPQVYKASLDVHTELLGKDQDTPWGEALTVRTNVSSGTGLRIDDGEQHGEHHEHEQEHPPN